MKVFSPPVGPTVKFSSGTSGELEVSKFAFGFDGKLFFRTDKEIGGIEAAHESIVWTLAWHPIGHILCSGSNDHTVKFWTRNRPGDQMRDKYNLNTLPPSLAGLEDYEMDEHIVIPGMGGEDRQEFGEPQLALNEPPPAIANSQLIHAPEATAALNDNGVIPGLDLEVVVRPVGSKVPYNKPIPKNFQARWNVESKSDEFFGTTAHDSASILICIRDVIKRILERMPGTIPLAELQPEKVQIYGKEIEVCRKFQFCFSSKVFKSFLRFTAGSKLHRAILEGFDSLYKFIHSGMIEELADVIPFEDNADYTAEDFVQDHATLTEGDEEDLLADPNQEEVEEEEDAEPRVKRSRSDFDSYDNDGSNDYDARFAPGIPSLLNLNLAPPRHGQEDEKASAKSPNAGAPWEGSNFHSANNKPSSNADRREGRRREGSRWSSSRR